MKQRRIIKNLKININIQDQSVVGNNEI